MWKWRTSLFAACLNRDSLFHLLSRSSCSTSNPEPIQKFHEARLSCQKVKISTLSEGMWGFSHSTSSPRASEGFLWGFSFPLWLFVSLWNLIRPQSESLWQSGQLSSLYPAEEKYRAVFRRSPILSSVPKMTKEVGFWKNAAQWVWTALISTASSILFSLFTCCVCTWSTMGKGHTFSPYKPAARCWLVRGEHIRWPKGQLLLDCPFACLSFGKRTTICRLFLHPHSAKIKQKAQTTPGAQFRAQPCHLLPPPM